jgi:hypothetical protein
MKTYSNSCCDNAHTPQRVFLVRVRHQRINIHVRCEPEARRKVSKALVNSNAPTAKVYPTKEQSLAVTHKFRVQDRITRQRRGARFRVYGPGASVVCRR